MQKRRRFFINREVQTRYLFLVILPALCLLVWLYYTVYYVMMREIVAPEGILSILVPALKKINIILLIGLPLIVWTLFRIGLRWSHRFAGPLYRLERDLDTIIATDDFSQRIAFRKTDLLHSLADKVNALLEKIEGDKKKWQKE